MTTISHAKNCILSDACSIANTAQCTRMCGHFIALHGFDGSGGRIAAAGVPADYRLTTLNNSPARAALMKEGADKTKSIYEFLTHYQRTFTRMFEPESERVKSLYLYSAATGTGKTTTAAALLNEWVRVSYVGSIRRNRQASDRPAYFLDVNALQTEFNTFNRPRVPDAVAAPASARYYHAMDAAIGAPFLVMDDIGVRDATEAFRADLHTIVNARVTNRLPTIYTSNIPMSELASVFDKRLADRVKDMCVEVAFLGESKRGMR